MTFDIRYLFLDYNLALFSMDKHLFHADHLPEYLYQQLLSIVV